VADPEVRQKLLNDAVADADTAAKQGQTTDRLLYNIACIYAQAAGQFEADVRSGRDRMAPQKQAYYEEKALRFLGLALEELPEDRRKKFWKKTVESDPILAGIRHGSVYFELAQRYGRPET
jgi:hypothetical protein